MRDLAGALVIGSNEHSEVLDARTSEVLDASSANNGTRGGGVSTGVSTGTRDIGTDRIVSDGGGRRVRPAIVLHSEPEAGPAP